MGIFVTVTVFQLPGMMTEVIEYLEKNIVSWICSTKLARKRTTSLWFVSKSPL